MTILEYYEGLAAAKRANASHTGTESQAMTPERLRYMYGSYVLAKRKKKGANKGYKETYVWQWSDYRGYMDKLRELFPTEYALMLCREERNDLMSDRWWDVDGYRAEHIRAYRDRIKEIRITYGLPKSAVSEFMSVG